MSQLKYKIQVFIIFLLLARLCFADNKIPVNVVEISNFSCPYCFLVHQQIDLIKQSIAAKKGIYDFVPIIWGELPEWPTKIYLSLKSPQADNVAPVLFNLMQTLPSETHSLNEICFALHNNLLDFTMNECKQAGISNQSLQRLTRAWKLLDYIGKHQVAIKLPIFILEKNNQVVKVLMASEYDDPQELVEAVMIAIENVS